MGTPASLVCVHKPLTRQRERNKQARPGRDVCANKTHALSASHHARMIRKPNSARTSQTNQIKSNRNESKRCDCCEHLSCNMYVRLAFYLVISSRMNEKEANDRFNDRVARTSSFLTGLHSWATKNTPPQKHTAASIYLSNYQGDSSINHPNTQPPREKQYTHTHTHAHAHAHARAHAQAPHTHTGARHRHKKTR